MALAEDYSELLRILCNVLFFYENREKMLPKDKMIIPNIHYEKCFNMYYFPFVKQN